MTKSEREKLFGVLPIDGFFRGMRKIDPRIASSGARGRQSLQPRYNMRHRNGHQSHAWYSHKINTGLLDALSF
jgi:hypothetical protein